MNHRKKARELPSYYNREFYEKKSLSEEMQIFRWFQLLQEHYQIFNVRNYHDCIRADRQEKQSATLAGTRPQPVIIKPFVSIDNFYGCIVCGKYHICHLRRETCPLIIDAHDKQKVCCYSGKLLLIQDNLEATFEDGQHADKEATYLVSPFGPRNHSSPKKQRSPKSKKPQRTHIQDLFSEKRDTEHEEKRKKEKKTTTADTSSSDKNPKKRLRLSDECRSMIRDDYDLSIDSLSEIEEEEVAYQLPALRARTNILADGTGEECEETEEEKKERECRPLKKARYLEMIKNVQAEEDDTPTALLIEEKEAELSDCEGDNDNDEEQHYKDWLDENDYAHANDDSGDEYGGGTTTVGSISEYDNENGESNRTKNYHNNIRYNNEYYAFLQPIVRKQQKRSAASLVIIRDDEEEASDEEMDQYDRFMDLYRRDIHEDEFYKKQKSQNESDDAAAAATTAAIDTLAAMTQSGTTTSLTSRTFSESEKLGESGYQKLSKETSKILNVLLKIDPTKRPLCKLKPSFIHQKLMEHFMPILQNITLLVYQSPVLAKLAMTRCTKNQNQVPKFGVSVLDLESVENLQSDIDYHEYTLCPTKIVRAMMLHLFIQPFSLTDSHGYRIDIWYRDQWLQSFNRTKAGRTIYQQTLCGDYYAYAARNNLVKSGVDAPQFRKEIQENASLILECLSFYKFCPLWLRNMVLNGHNDVILNVPVQQ